MNRFLRKKQGQGSKEFDSANERKKKVRMLLDYSWFWCIIRKHSAKVMVKNQIDNNRNNEEENYSRYYDLNEKGKGKCKL